MHCKQALYSADCKVATTTPALEAGTISRAFLRNLLRSQSVNFGRNIVNIGEASVVTPSHIFRKPHRDPIWNTSR